jgi:hypothetical protein
MPRNVYEFTVICVMEGEDPADAWQQAMAYLAEHAAKCDLEYSGVELLEEDA